MNHKAIKLVIADDHPVVLHGLVSLLKSEPDFRVLAARTDGASALEAIRTYSPDIALLDLRLPRMTGLEVLEKISNGTPPTRVVILTAFAESPDLLVAVSRGARGIVLKESAANVLVRCLRHVHAGGLLVPQELIRQAQDRQRETALVFRLLTSREREVVRLVAGGLSNKGAAAALKISEGTVKLHLHNVYFKMGMSGRLALMTLARRLGEELTIGSISQAPRQKITEGSLLQ